MNTTNLELDTPTIDHLGRTIAKEIAEGARWELDHRKTFGSGIITCDTEMERAYHDSYIDGLRRTFETLKPHMTPATATEAQETIAGAKQAALAEDKVRQERDAREVAASKAPGLATNLKDALAILQGLQVRKNATIYAGHMATLADLSQASIRAEAGLPRAYEAAEHLADTVFYRYRDAPQSFDFDTYRRFTGALQAAVAAGREASRAA